MERCGVLIVDHQNLIGRTKSLGLFDFDPDWLVNSALRIANCEGLILVTDLTIYNPITNTQYLYEAERWAKAGFKIVHVPSRHARQVPTEAEVNEHQTKDAPIYKYRRKDLTDGGIHTELRHWCAMPQLTDIILFSHDVDFAQDLLWVATATDKRAVLFHMGTDSMAQALRESANEHVNVLENLVAYSVSSLDKRRFWHKNQDIEILGQMVWKWASDKAHETRNRPVLRQLADAQSLIKFIALDLLCISTKSMPGAQRLSWRMLQEAIAAYLVPEKIVAGRSNLKEEAGSLVQSQQHACMVGIDHIMKIWQDNEVLIHDMVQHPTYGNHKQFFLNMNHPAVTLLMETDFI